jgi:hypothetical protein
MEMKFLFRIAAIAWVGVGLPLHYMAPVTGVVADGEEDGFVLNPGPMERLLTPGVPIHRIMRVQQKVRTLLVYQVIAVRRLRSGLTGGSESCTEVAGQNHAV